MPHYSVQWRRREEVSMREGWREMVLGNQKEGAVL